MRDEPVDFSHVDDLACTPSQDGNCAICSDEALPGQVESLGTDNMALVRLSNGRQEVALDLIETPQVGDWVLVHLGFAIARVDK
jgi:hydrogenase assembly chaperone HypC/HupF